MIKDKEKAYGALYQRTSRNLFIRGERKGHAAACAPCTRMWSYSEVIPLTPYMRLIDNGRKHLKRTLAPRSPRKQGARNRAELMGFIAFDIPRSAEGRKTADSSLRDQQPRSEIEFLARTHRREDSRSSRLALQIATFPRFQLAESFETPARMLIPIILAITMIISHDRTLRTSATVRARACVRFQFPVIHCKCKTALSATGSSVITVPAGRLPTRGKKRKRKRKGRPKEKRQRIASSDEHDETEMLKRCKIAASEVIRLIRAMCHRIIARQRYNPAGCSV